MSKLIEDFDDFADEKGYTKSQLLKPVELPMLANAAGTTAYLAEQLMEHNFVVFDGMLGEKEALALREEVKTYWDSGLMQHGQIGTGQDASTGVSKKTWRDDHIVWMEGKEKFVGPLMKRHIMRCDILTQKLAIFFEAVAPEFTWEGAGRTKIMATRYGGDGARYVAHYDNPNQNGRKLTCITYLNPFWTPKDGGMLRVKTKNQIVEIAPLLDRVLLFWSDKRVPHEVMRATGKDRFAVTIWYLDENERIEAERRQTACDDNAPPPAAAAAP